MGVIVFSGANITVGGPLEIFKNILKFADSNYFKYRILAIVSDRGLFEKDYKNVEFIEIKNYKKFILLKLYYEYFRFYLISKKKDVDLWFSLNDCTPTVKAKVRAVYCHNATPFYKRTWRDYLNPTIAFLQSFYYIFFYKINLKNNNFIIVQQQWIKNFFNTKFFIEKNKIIINHPLSEQNKQDFLSSVGSNNSIYTFLYPTKAQPYKNLEVILKAAEQLEDYSSNNFRIVLTTSGHENNYSRKIYNKYKHLKSIEWKGFVSKSDLETLYLNSNCLLFSSKLETWGLPISEFKAFQKPMLLPNLPYARETMGNYQFGKFFDPDNFVELCNFMERVIKNDLDFDQGKIESFDLPYTVGFQQLFNILLNNDKC